MPHHCQFIIKFLLEAEESDPTAVKQSRSNQHETNTEISFTKNEEEASLSNHSMTTSCYYQRKNKQKKASIWIHQLLMCGSEGYKRMESKSKYVKVAK